MRCLALTPGGALSLQAMNNHAYCQDYNLLRQNPVVGCFENSIRSLLSCQGSFKVLLVQTYQGESIKLSSPTETTTFALVNELTQVRVFRQLDENHALRLFKQVACIDSVLSMSCAVVVRGTQILVG
jgi:hypothetical protein